MRATFPTFTRVSAKVLFIVILVILVLSLVATAALGYLYYQTQQQLNPQQASNREVQQLTHEVGKLIDLPDETPTVATVTDKEKLQSQPFFTRAENGDKVLIYQEAQKAYLYRPSQHLLIEVAPLTLTPEATPSSNDSVTVTPSPSPIFSVTLYNGTPTIGLTTNYEKSLTNLFPGATINLKQNAAKADYQDSVIIDLKGNQTELVAEIAEKLDLTVQTLPEGEIAPESQILIILGSDAVN